MKRGTCRIAVFGGSFDPPHCAHVMVASWVLTCTETDLLLVIPTYTHPFAKASSPFETRVAMCRAAFSCFGRRVRVSDIEARLSKPSYTVNTLRYLQRRYKDVKFSLIIGSDIPPETPQWRDFEEIQRLANVIVVNRGSRTRESDTPVFPDVSSSAIRSAIAEGRDVSSLVPVSVLEIIRRESLYGCH